MSNNKSTETLKKLLPVYLALALFYGAFTFLTHYNSLPRGVHQWAQADRYAISERYLEGRELLNPATYSIISDNGDVGVEFPLIQFVAAKIAMIFSIENLLPEIYRTLSFLLVLLGFVILTRRFIENSRFRNFLIIVTLLSSPIFIFYGHNFLPDAASFGLVLIALGLMPTKPGFRYVPVILILTLASLIKTSSGIYLLGVLAYIFIQTLRKKIYISSVVAVLCGIFCLIGIAYYDYFYIYQRNQHLWSTLFLSQTQAISSFSELSMVFRSFWHWKFEYLNFGQWLLIILGLISYIRSIRSKNTDRLLVLIIIAVGYLGFIILFGKQFIYHDYYALATFGPGFVYLMILGLKILSERPNKGISTLILLVLAVVSFSVGSSHYFERMNEYVVMGNQEYRHDFKWLKEIDQTTDLYLNDTSKIFVVYEAEPNLALVYLHKKGIVFNHEEMGREESNFYYWLDRRKPGFVLCRNTNLQTFKEGHSEFIMRTDVAFQNSDYTLFEVNGY